LEFLLCTLTPEVQCRLVHRNHVIWRTKIKKCWRNGKIRNNSIVLLILMEFMIITVYTLSFHINQWKELVCWKYVFCWGSLDGICISCEVPSIADTALGISEQYIFFCHQTGMVGHWILRLQTFYKSTHVEFKTLSTVETLTPKHI
jgi:hypothetical protein